MPLGFFNSHSTGLVLTPEECVELYREVPALCGLKNGLLDAEHSLAVHKLAPEMVLWEAADEAGVRLGIPHPGALRSALYLYEKPGAPLFSEWREPLVPGDFQRDDTLAAAARLNPMR